MGGIGSDVAESGSPFVYGAVHIPVNAITEGIVVRIRGLGREGVRSRGVAGDGAGDGWRSWSGVASDGGEVKSDGLGGEIDVVGRNI